jgi:hypothetical protein
MNPGLNANLLHRLIDAEKNDAPLTREMLLEEIADLTFAQAWSEGHIAIRGQEDAHLSVAHLDSEFITSASGKAWLMEYERNRC